MPVSEARRRAGALYQARVDRVPIKPFTDGDATLGADDGYAVQRELVELLVADGERVIGYKAGLTSAAMQVMFGVDSPDYGPVMASTVYVDGATIPAHRFIAPKVEAEIVFRLGTRLAGPGVTVGQARAAIAQVMAGLEIVDSRIEGWRIGLADTIADLASAGAVVLAPPAVVVPDQDFRLIGMVFSHNSEIVATGAGAAAMGDPVAVVAWLANALGAWGVVLEPGQLIMTGALHAAVPMAPGDTFVAEFDRLGTVGVQVTGPAATSSTG